MGEGGGGRGEPAAKTIQKQVGKKGGVFGPILGTRASNGCHWAELEEAVLGAKACILHRGAGEGGAASQRQSTQKQEEGGLCLPGAHELC